MDEQFERREIKNRNWSGALMKETLGKERSKKDFMALSPPCPAP